MLDYLLTAYILPTVWRSQFAMGQEAKRDGDQSGEDHQDGLGWKCLGYKTYRSIFAWILWCLTLRCKYNFEMFCYVT